MRHVGPCRRAARHHELVARPGLPVPLSAGRPGRVPYLAIAGNITTAGPAFAHLDLALSLVHRVSPALADLTARYLVLGDRPSQAAAALPALLAAGDPTVAAFERHIREHLPGPIGVGEAARDIGVSERTLQRATAALGMSPVRFVQEVRLEQAVHLLRATSQTPDAVAAAVGYADARTGSAAGRAHSGSLSRAFSTTSASAGWIQY